MNYSPKLRRLHTEIEALLKANDVAGAVVLHEPGFAQVNCFFSPSYSCAKYVLDNNGQGHVEINLQGKGDLDEKEQYRVRVSTGDLFVVLADFLSDIARKMDLTASAVCDALQLERGNFVITQHKPHGEDN